MRAVVVDNEKPAVQQLVQMLESFRCFTEIVVFAQSREALAYARSHKIDVACIDVALPDANGIVLAHELRRLDEELEIILITAHDCYAIAAFELQALDYILKPLTESRLQRTIKRLLMFRPPQPEEQKKQLHCLGELRFTDGEKSILLEKWRTKKVRELFCFLLHNRNKLVHRDTLIELLWPDMDVRAAGTNLHSAIYQLRKTLEGYHIAVRLNRVGDCYQLELQDISIDVDIVQEQARTLPALGPDTWQEHHHFLSLYTDGYFQHSDYWWAEGKRIRLQSLWMEQAFLLAEFYTKQGRYREAIEVYSRIQLIDPYEERAYLHLQSVYKKTGDAEASRRQQAQLQRLQRDII